MTSCQHIIKGASAAAPKLISPRGHGANKAAGMIKSRIFGAMFQPLPTVMMVTDPTPSDWIGDLDLRRSDTKFPETNKNSMAASFEALVLLLIGISDLGFST